MKSKKSEKKTYAEPRTLVAEVDGVKYTKRTACNYRYFWICNAILPDGSITENAACGWSYKPVNKDGQHPEWSNTWFYTKTRCVRVHHAEKQGDTTVGKEKVDMTEQIQTEEADVLACVHPRDIDRLCPSIGEPAYVDAYGDGHYKTMILASITPHYVTFREGTMTGIGWVAVKVSRIWTGLGFAFALWRSPRGWLHCQLQEVEA